MHKTVHLSVSVSAAVLALATNGTTGAETDQGAHLPRQHAQ
jgi:hypothetical protein